MYTTLDGRIKINTIDLMFTSLFSLQRVIIKIITKKKTDEFSS